MNRHQKGYPAATWKLTDYEVAALPGQFNLAEGHARYTLSPAERGIIQEKIAQVLTDPLPQAQLEAEFGEHFFGLAHELDGIDRRHLLYCPSASISIEIVANYLRLQHHSVALLEPTFDNLPDILRRHAVPLQPLAESELRQNGIEHWLAQVQADAIFLVMPNNPTGYLGTDDDFQQLVAYCARNDKLLILDCTFRFFAPPMWQWHQYRQLEEAGISYIVIEDTGKVWPSADLKISPMVADEATYLALRTIYRDIMVAHSPLAFAIIGALVKQTRELGIEQTILPLLATNRRRLHETLAGTFLAPVGLPYASVEWLAIETPEMDDCQLVQTLQSTGVYTLPGSNFFWYQPQAGRQFLRIALMRDPALFAASIQHLRQALPPSMLR